MRLCQKVRKGKTLVVLPTSGAVVPRIREYSVRSRHPNAAVPRVKSAPNSLEKQGSGTSAAPLPNQLRRYLEHISALDDLNQKVLHRRPEQMARTITEQASQRDRAVLESLKVVEYLHRAVRI